jgi:hypothetical protein
MGENLITGKTIILKQPYVIRRADDNPLSLGEGGLGEVLQKENAHAQTPCMFSYWLAKI